MATRIRLSRRGRKKYARYDIVVADSRAPRDGRFIEKLGIYNPNAKTKTQSVVLDEDKAFDWVMKGAVPSDTARELLSASGVLLRKHLQVGVLKGAIKQEEADKKYQAWKAEKDKKTLTVEEAAAKKLEDERKTRLAAEAKVSEARKAAQIAAATPPAAEVEEAAEAAEETAAPAEEATAPEAEAKEEAPKAEEKEEAPKAEAPAEEAPKGEASEEEKGKE